MIGAGVCIGDEERFQTLCAPSLSRLGIPTLTRRHQSSIFTAYNSMLDEAATRCPEGLVLLHDDVEIRDPSLLDKLSAQFSDETVGLVGVIGATHVKSIAWWDGTTYGRALDTGRELDFGGAGHEVDAIDGFFMAVSPQALLNIRFDERRFTGFHGYDVDYSFSVRNAGLKVLIADIDLFHHWKQNLGDELAYHTADLVWQDKWQPLEGLPNLRRRARFHARLLKARIPNPYRARLRAARSRVQDMTQGRRAR